MPRQSPVWVEPAIIVTLIATLAVLVLDLVFRDNGALDESIALAAIAFCSGIALGLLRYAEHYDRPERDP